MKNLFRVLGVVLLMATTNVGCNKPTEETKMRLALAEKKARAQGDLTYTIQIDYLIEVWGKDTLRYDFTKDPVIHSKWMFDMWRGSADGYIYGQNSGTPNEGHGIRYTPIDPREPSGPRVVREFTWEMDPVTLQVVAQIGSNRAEIIPNIPYIIIHQFKGPGINEIERWYYGHQTTNGNNMDGLGAKRTS